MDRNRIIMVIVMDSSTGTACSYKLPQQSRVTELKRMIADKMNKFEHNIELCFQGEIMSDMNNLEYYDIIDGDVIITLSELLDVPPYFPILSILPLTDGYDKLELRDVVNIDQIINHIHNRYNNIDKINIQLYNNADKTGLIINITDISIGINGVPVVYYLIK